MVQKVNNQKLFDAQVGIEEKKHPQSLTDEAVVNVWVAAKGGGGWRANLAKSKLLRPLLTRIARAWVRKYNHEQDRAIAGLAGQHILTRPQKEGRAVVHHKFVEQATKQQVLLRMVLEIKKRGPELKTDLGTAMSNGVIGKQLHGSLAEVLDWTTADDWQSHLESSDYQGHVEDIKFLSGTTQTSRMEDLRSLQWQQRVTEFLPGVRDIPTSPPGSATAWEEQMLLVAKDKFPHIPDEQFIGVSFPESKDSAQTFKGLERVNELYTPKPATEHTLEIDVAGAARRGDTAGYDALTQSKQEKVAVRLNMVADTLREHEWNERAIEMGITNLLKAVGAEHVARVTPSLETTIASDYSNTILALGKGEQLAHVGRFMATWPEAARNAGLSDTLAAEVSKTTVLTEATAYFRSPEDVTKLASAIKILSVGAEIDDESILVGLGVLIATRADRAFEAADDRDLAARIVPPENLILEPRHLEQFKGEWEAGLKPTFFDNERRQELRNAFLAEFGHATPYKKRVAGWEPSDALRNMYAEIEAFSKKNDQYSPAAVVKAFRARVIEDLQANDQGSGTVLKDTIVPSIAKEQAKLFTAVVREELMAQLPASLHPVVPDLMRRLGPRAQTQALNSVQLSFVRDLGRVVNVSATKNGLSSPQVRGLLDKIRESELLHADQVLDARDAQARLEKIGKALSRETTKVGVDQVISSLENEPLDAVNRVITELGSFLGTADESARLGGRVLGAINESKEAQAATSRIVMGLIPDDLRARGAAVKVKPGKALLHVDLPAITEPTLEEFKRIANGEVELVRDTKQLKSMTATQRAAHTQLAELIDIGPRSEGVAGAIYGMVSDEQVQGLLSSPRLMNIVKSILTPIGLRRVGTVVKLFMKPIKGFISRQLKQQVTEIKARIANPSRDDDVKELRNQLALLNALSKEETIAPLIELVVTWLPAVVERHPDLHDHIDLLGMLAQRVQGVDVDPKQVAGRLANLYGEVGQYGSLINGIQAAALDVPLD